MSDAGLFHQRNYRINEADNGKKGVEVLEKTRGKEKGYALATKCWEEIRMKILHIKLSIIIHQINRFW